MAEEVRPRCRLCGCLVANHNSRGVCATCSCTQLTLPGETAND